MSRKERPTPASASNRYYLRRQNYGYDESADNDDDNDGDDDDDDDGDDDGDDGDDDDKRKRDRCLHCSQTPSPCTQCHRHCTKLLRTPVSHLFPSLLKKTSHVTCNICIPASESTIETFTGIKTNFN